MKALLVVLVTGLFSLGIYDASIASRLRHDIHISYGQAELVGSKLTGKFTYYKEDFNRAVGNWYNIPVESRALRVGNDLRINYLRNYFRVWMNGLEQQLAVEITGHNEDESSIWFEFSVQVPEHMKFLTLDNRILFKEYSDQMNLLLVKAFSREHNYIFTSSATTFYLQP